ncbi:exosome complex component RRP46 [Nematocida sp. AWRm77]|nr:exosome complex component RRP46 [Nematocida sp. AWRm77]
MYREDGRRNTQHRDLSISLGTGITLHHGLAQVTTTIEHQKNSNKRGMTIEVVLEKSSHQKFVADIHIERKKEELESALHKVFCQVFLETEIHYHIQHKVSYANGSLLSMLINSTSLALCWYAIPIKHMIFGLTCGLSKRERGEYLVDLTEKEEKERMSTIVLAQPYIQHKELVSLMQLSGLVSFEEYTHLVQSAQSALVQLSRTLKSLLQSTDTPGGRAEEFPSSQAEKITDEI